MSTGSDRVEIARLIGTFFGAFRSGPDIAARMDAMRAIMLPGAVIVRTCGTTPAVYDVDGFIAPRLALLTGGSVTDFREWSLSGRIEVFGDIAHHWGGYAKEWTEGGTRRTGRGAKTIQFVRTDAGWRISAVAWDDERPGLELPASLS